MHKFSINLLNYCEIQGDQNIIHQAQSPKHHGSIDQDYSKKQSHVIQIQKPLIINGTNASNNDNEKEQKFN